MVFKKALTASSLVIGLTYATTSFSIPTTVIPPALMMIGGDLAKPGQFPWQAELYFKNKFTCSASIIDKQWILTAAHCVMHSKNPTEYKIIVGNLKRNGSDGKVLTVSKVIKNPNFTSYHLFQRTNDVAVLKLSTPLKFNDKIARIELAPTPPEELGVKKTLTTSGWGDTTPEGKPTARLRYIEKNLMDNNLCHDYFVKVDPKQHLHLCTTPDSTHGICDGDSGAPLIYRSTPSGTPYQIGIASFGEIGCDLNYPDVYTNVYSQKQWIEQQIAKG